MVTETLSFTSALGPVDGMRFAILRVAARAPVGRRGDGRGEPMHGKVESPSGRGAALD